MKKSIFYITLFCLVIGCNNLDNTTFILTAKHPQTISDMEIYFPNDTLAYITSLGNQQKIQEIYFRKKKNYLIISSNTGQDLVQLNKGDTIILYKKELIIFNKTHKLIFRKNQNIK